MPKFKSTTMRIPTGLAGLDQLTGGGFLPGSANLVVGGFGTGKTILGIQFLLAGASNGNVGLFISLQDDFKDSVLPHLDLAKRLNRQIKNSKVLVSSLIPTDERALTDCLQELEILCEKRNVSRIVIDGFHYSYHERHHDMVACIGFFRRLGITVVFTYGTPMKPTELSVAGDYLAAQCDTVLFLRHRAKREIAERDVMVLKFRGAKAASRARPFFISDQGMIMPLEEGPQRKRNSRGKKEVIFLQPAAILDDLWERYFTAMVASLPKRFSRYKFRMEIQGAAELRKTLARKQTDIALLLIPLSTIPEFARRQRLVPLTGRVRDSLLSLYLPRVLEGCRYKGELYVLPKYINYQQILYNKDLLDKYGYAPPTTWHELIDQARYIMRREPQVETGLLVPAAVGNSFWSIYLFYLDCLWNSGLDIINPRGSVVMTKQTGKAGVRFLKDLIYKHKIMSYHGFEIPLFDALKSFFNGEAVFIHLSSDFIYHKYDDIPVKIKVGECLLEGHFNDYRPTFTMFGNGLGIPANTSHPELAWELLQQLSDFKKNLQVHRKIGFKRGLNAYKKYYPEPAGAEGQGRIPDIIRHGCFYAEREPYYRQGKAIAQEIWSMLRHDRNQEQAIKRINDHMWYYKNQERHSQTVSKVISYIETNYARPLNLTQLASVLNISVYYMEHLFKREMDCGCLDYVITVRMQRACDLLVHSRYRINEIARQVGYTDPYYFSRLFKKRMHVSPARYRTAFLSD